MPPLLKRRRRNISTPTAHGIEGTAAEPTVTDESSASTPQTMSQVRHTAPVTPSTGRSTRSRNPADPNTPVIKYVWGKGPVLVNADGTFYSPDHSPTVDLPHVGVVLTRSQRRRVYSSLGEDAIDETTPIPSPHIQAKRRPNSAAPKPKSRVTPKPRAKPVSKANKAKAKPEPIPASLDSEIFEAVDDGIPAVEGPDQADDFDIGIRDEGTPADDEPQTPRRSILAGYMGGNPFLPISPHWTLDGMVGTPSRRLPALPLQPPAPPAVTPPSPIIAVQPTPAPSLSPALLPSSSSSSQSSPSSPPRLRAPQMLPPPLPLKSSSQEASPPPRTPAQDLTSGLGLATIISQLAASMGFQRRNPTPIEASRPPATLRPIPRPASSSRAPPPYLIPDPLHRRASTSLGQPRVVSGLADGDDDDLEDVESFIRMTPLPIPSAHGHQASSLYSQPSFLRESAPVFLAAPVGTKRAPLRIVRRKLGTAPNFTASGSSPPQSMPGLRTTDASVATPSSWQARRSHYGFNPVDLGNQEPATDTYDLSD